MKCDCTKCKTSESCNQRECDWYINDPKYFNCFNVMKHFINRPYTLGEIAKLLGVSHTKIKIIEAQALKKLQATAGCEDSDV